MDFKIEKDQFTEGLSKAESIISPREIRSALSNVLIEAKDNRLVLTASDFEITISTVLSAEVVKSGEIAIPARKLSEIADKLKAETISLNVNENNNVNIGSASTEQGTHYSLMGSPKEDYPVIPDIPDKKYKEVTRDTMIEMFDHVAYAMAKEDARYVFNGLYIIPQGRTGTFVATDGRRLSLIQKEFPEDFPLEEPIILPHKTVREVQKLSSEEDSISLAYNKTDKRIYFKVGNTTISSKLIDGTFPDYKQVIPETVEHEILINKENLESSIEQVAVMAVKPTLQIRFIFDKNRLFLYSSTPDVGEAENNLPIEYEGEEKIETAFNSTYVMDILKSLKTENIIFGISSSSSPASIQKPGDKDFTAIVMPMKI